VRVGGEEHEDATLDALHEASEQETELSETLLHVLVAEIELELVALEVVFEHCGENLRILDKVLIHELDFELGAQSLVENFHRLQSATRQNHAERPLLGIPHNLLEDQAGDRAVNAPLRDVVLWGSLIQTLVRLYEKLEVFCQHLSRGFVSARNQAL